MKFTHDVEGFVEGSGGNIVFALEKRRQKFHLEGFGDAVRRNPLEPGLFSLVLAHTLRLALVLSNTAISVVSQCQIILYVS